MTSSDLIDLQITLAGRNAPSETHFTRAGAWVLTIATTLPGPEGPVVELHSTYTGHPGLRTRSTHLQLGPASQHADVLSVEHRDDARAEDCLVLFRPRELAYDHAHRLLELLQQLGELASVEIPEHAFGALERPAVI